MTSLRKFSIVLLVAASLFGLMTMPALAAVTVNCGGFPATMTLGSSYQLTCSATGGTAPYQWTVAGTYPPSMSYQSFTNGEEFELGGAASTAGSYQVALTATDANNNSGTSAQIPFTVSSGGGTSTGTISLSSISPNTITAGQQTTIVVFGTNFTSSSVVYFNGTVLAATYISSGELFVTVPSYLAIAGTLPVYVHDPTNGSSGTVYITVSGTSTTGSLQLTSISPSSAPLDSAALTVTIFGSGFSAGSTLNFGTVCEVGTTYLGSTELQATIPASCLTTAATLNVSVGSSNSVTFTIGGSTGGTGIITLTSFYPSSLTPGATQGLQLYGTNFTPNTEVFFNNTYVQANYQNSSTYITATIPGTLVTSGSLPVYLRDPTNGQSATLYIPVSGSTQTGSITLTSISPTSITTPGTAFTLFINGANFTPSSLIHFNNNILSITYESSTQIYASIPGSYVTSGSLPVYVSDPVNGTSATTYLTVGGSGSTGTITLSTISPTTATAGVGFPLYLYGSNFTASTIVYFNSSALAATFINSTQLYLNIPGSLVTSGTDPVYVSDPVYGTSTTQYVSVSGISTGSGVTLSQLVPSTIAAGSQAFVLTLYGANFTSGALVTFGAYNLSGSVINSGQLQVTVPAQYVATSATVNVSVGGSNSLQFTISGSTTGTLSVFCSPSTGPTSVNVSYSQTCSVSGGTAPYTWTVSGLPNGLSQSAYTGGSSVTISGTPTIQQPYSYVVQVTDSSATRLTGSTSVSGNITSSTSSGYSITSISPTTISVGSPATTLTVNGSGFTSASQVYFNGVAAATSFVSSAQLTATIPATSLATAGNVSVSVYTSGAFTNSVNLVIGSGSTSSGGLTVTCTPGVGPQTQYVQYSMTCSATGGTQPYNWSTTGLAPYLSLNTTSGPSIIVSGTPTTTGSYNFTLKATDSSSPALTGSLQIAGQITTTSTTGGITITSLSPSSAPQNSAAVSLTVVGSGFTTTSQVTFASIPIVTTFVSGSVLIATIPSNLLTQPFAAQVTVSTSGIGTSNSLAFIIGTNVANPVSITCSPGVGPTAPNTYYSQTCNANGGTAPFTWSILSGALPSGLSLSSTSGVQTSIGGYNTLTGPYSYTIQVIDSSSPPNVGTAVFAGTTGVSSTTGGLSLTSLSPTSIAPGAGNTTLTLSGTGFSASSVVYFNSTVLSTTFVNSGQLTATIPSSLLTTAITASITVQSAGFTSNALSLTVGAGASTAITISCSPSTGPPGTGVSYLATCTASGGKAPFTWTSTPPLSSALLGLVLGNSNSSTITISGTTFVSGSYAFTLQVADSSTPQQTASYQFAGTLPTGEGGGFGGTITSISPVTSPVNAGQFTLTVTGTGFQSGLSFILFGSYPLPTTYISSTQLTGVVPASLLSTPGTTMIQVQTSGVGSTNQVGFFVNGASAVAVAPSSLTFNYALGGVSPSPQVLSITSTAAISGFSLSANGVANNINWLSASPASGTIPGTVTVIVAPASLAIGTYSGSITVTGFGTGLGTTIPVTLNILATPGLKSSLTTLTFTTPTGSTAATQTLQITSTDGQTPIPFNINGAANSGTWLSVSPSSGTTPATFTVTANATSLTANTYRGQVNVIPTGVYGAPLALPVTLTVTGPVTLTASPASLSFAGVTGQSNPAAQTINLTSTVAANYTVAATTASGGSWLTATASNGTTPGTISVSTSLSGLAAGTYNGTVTVTSTGATNSPLAIPVTLTVGNPAPLGSSPSSLTFSYQLGGTAPAAQTLSISAPSGSTAAFNYSVAAATSTGGSWLSATPTSGTTPGTVNV
jgi:hypothetical protein